MLMRSTYLGVRNALRETFPSDRRLVQADFDEMAATAVQDRAEGKTKRPSPKEALERIRSRSSEERELIDEHLFELMLSFGAAKLPEMSKLNLTKRKPGS